ncbi:hypothetical protein PPTG_04085 [Phytophthora nicotianae INRA-310]|uniref:Uncharacterized protein n=2 Tax=Phytophthora nicotianae TaxID=4792 RepID=W2R1W0_PHYN3|nr:hypothetical protein PPTG_04085 [Phytophthora nicotianae INRA-310]ETN18495.1 hypothetical protein PPTG_04085 [Phytophthora nicotianae INRA-310]KUF88347.1 hypothetical protein AM588_10001775 [Phytophthora nicotianae]
MARSRILFAFLAAVVGFTLTESIATPRSLRTVATEPPGSLVSSSSASNSGIEFATPATATSTVRSTYRNWVGSWSMSPDTACYRKAHIMDVCPSNYDRNEATNTCWTECPLDYPVECGMECIRQNDDCGIEVTSKVTAVAMTILSSATFGVFGELAKLGQKISWAVKCSNSMMLVLRGIIRYIRTMKAEDPQATDRQLLILLYQTSTVVTDLPIAITICMGKAVPPNLRLSQYVLSTAEWVLMQVLAHDDSIISSWGRFRAFLKGANFTEAAEEITEGEIESLETAMKQNSSCAGDLKSLTDRVWLTVNEYRQENPAITDDEIRLKISDSDLVLYDVPTVTNNCMHQMISESSLTTAYKTREVLRKTFGVIIDDLIKSGKSDNGTSYDEKEKAYKVVDFAFSTAAATLLDPTRITLLFSEYIQTVCGPTQFMGEIDDGTDAATLGLNTLEDAFKGSKSSWTKKGDGKVIINFKSTDTKDVTVNIMSGGDRIDEVDVKAGGTAQWNSTVKALGGKTLYLDRWRPGFLGLPGTGGGSLVLWVPRASQGGHLEIEAKLNVS